MNQYVPGTPRLASEYPRYFDTKTASSPAAVVPQIRLHTSTKGKEIDPASPYLTGSFQIPTTPVIALRTPISRSKPQKLVSKVHGSDWPSGDQMVPSASPLVGNTVPNESPARPTGSRTRRVTAISPLASTQSVTGFCKPPGSTSLPPGNGSSISRNKAQWRPTPSEQGRSTSKSAANIDLFSGEDYFA